jgi:hypothetical protein
MVVELIDQYLLENLPYPASNQIPRYPDPPPPPKPPSDRVYTDTSFLPGIDPRQVIQSSPQMVRENGNGLGIELLLFMILMTLVSIFIAICNP